MNKKELIELLRSGVDKWNLKRASSFGQTQLARRWHYAPPSAIAVPDLSGADLSELSLLNCNLAHANLRGANLYRTNLTGADLNNADLSGCDLQGAVLEMASMDHAKLRSANLVGANLHGASLRWSQMEKVNLATATLVEANFQGAACPESSFYAANLIQANLTGADIRGSDLQSAILVDTNITDARLSGCSIYGLSAWRLRGSPTEQGSLTITPHDESRVTVENLEVAQFVYLLLNNRKIRDVIDTITSKVVLILGRFTPARKKILDAIKAELGARDYLPILFDFDKPARRDTVETISTLAHMARFIIADLTDAKSVLQEIQRIVPSLPSVPIQPLIMAKQQEPGMFDHFRNFRTMLPVHRYTSTRSLLESFVRVIIAPAEQAASDLAPTRRRLTPHRS